MGVSEKAKRAALDPRRPGEKCGARPGAYLPVVDRHRCEGKGDCVEVCPYGVFELGTLEEAEYRAMPALVRLKQWVHGKKTVRLVHPEACQACGLCVVVCPEDALSLQRV